MMPPKDETLTADIYSLLYRLGISATSISFFHTAYAVRLAVEQPQVLLLVTKWLYPEVAKQYRSTWRAVERNIRRVIMTIWENKPGLLAEIAGYPLAVRPTPSQFLSILAAYLTTDSVA